MSRLEVRWDHAADGTRPYGGEFGGAGGAANPNPPGNVSRWRERSRQEECCPDCGQYYLQILSRADSAAPSEKSGRGFFYTLVRRPDRLAIRKEMT